MCILLQWGPPIGWERYFVPDPSLIHSHTAARCVVVPVCGAWVLIKPNPCRASSLCSTTPAGRLSQECRNLLSHNSSNRPPHGALRGTGDEVTQISVKKKGKNSLLKRKNKVLKNNGGGERNCFSQTQTHTAVRPALFMFPPYFTEKRKGRVGDCYVVVNGRSCSRTWHRASGLWSLVEWNSATGLKWRRGRPRVGGLWEWQRREIERARRVWNAACVFAAFNAACTALLAVIKISMNVSKASPLYSGPIDCTGSDCLDHAELYMSPLGTGGFKYFGIIPFIVCTLQHIYRIDGVHLYVSKSNKTIVPNKILTL